MTATYADWIANAEHHYERASALFHRAAEEATKGDPGYQFDPLLRMATWHTQTGGLALGLARAVSDRASR